MPEKVVRFGEFTLDFGCFQLFYRESAVKLEGRPLQVLMLLVERAGQLVSREEIAEALWGPDVFVDVEQGINTAIRKVRMALGDCSRQPTYLQTVVGRGYRFVRRGVIESDGVASAVADMFNAEELGQAILSAAGLSDEQSNGRKAPSPPRRDFSVE